MPQSLRLLYLTKARTHAPFSSRASTRWEPIKPPAPVTSTFLPFKIMDTPNSGQKCETFSVKQEIKLRKWKAVSNQKGQKKTKID
jgi:hypothetical protein